MVFFKKRVPQNLKKRSSRQLRKISYANTVIPTEIPTIDKTAIPTNNNQGGRGMIQYQKSGWYRLGMQL
jgi:hypothetical protein